MKEHNDCVDSNIPCPVNSKVEIPLDSENTNLKKIHNIHPIIKVPVVLAEKDIQIVLEADVKLCPPATEIKRVKKHVFLDQVKLVPVRFKRIEETGFFKVEKAKLFVSGHIRKNIEYAGDDCNGVIYDKIVDLDFEGFTEIKEYDFFNFPIIGISENAEANFLNEKTNLDARLDKAFFQNLVQYNEQPYGELVAANFFELDFSPKMVEREKPFHKLREKIVLDLTLKVLQVQQLKIEADLVIPKLKGLSLCECEEHKGPHKPC